MSKIKKDIQQDVNQQDIKRQQKKNLKNVFLVVKSVILLTLIQLLGQILYMIVFTLSIPDARANTEIFTTVMFSSSVTSAAYYFGHLFTLLFVLFKAIGQARVNTNLGQTTIGKLLTQIDWKPLKNIFYGWNCFAVGLTMHSVSTTIISLILILILGTNISQTFFTVSPWAIFIVGICMPITEELIFRGQLLKRLSNHFDEKRANQIQAIGYSVIHGFSGQSFADFVMGYMFGKMKQMTGSIIAPLVAHIGANSLDAILLTFPDITNYRAFGIVYSIITVYGAVVLIFLLFKSVWNKTKK